jgi:hypothetical protein
MSAGRLPPPTQRQHAREAAITVGADARHMSDPTFLPDPDDAAEAKIAVRKAGRDAAERAGRLADRLAEIDIHQREARYLLERAGMLTRSPRTRPAPE